MKSKLTIPLAIICGGAIIALAVYMSMPKYPTNPEGNPALVRAVDTSDHIFGNPAAKVMIVEYADYDCEFCSGFSDTLHQIVANEGADGNVAWVYRQFPLIEIHPNAFKHAEAAECAAVAGGNDAFWEFSDALYAHQPVDPSEYGTLAQTLSIPGDAFARCYANASSTVNNRILADRKNALEVGAQGTPYSLILVIGQPPIVINGGYPYEAVKLLVDQALAKVK
jgi:protein-disulfide isomerase